VNAQSKASQILTGSPEPSGRVRFDERGNAVWETWRGRRLEHPGLSIVEDEALSPAGAAPVNVKGGRIGYNPYESGMVKKKTDQVPKKKDLRALSQWIQLQKSLPQKG
jgi:hypothetical protein